jgi:hypothetical protein
MWALVGEGGDPDCGRIGRERRRRLASPKWLGQVTGPGWGGDADYTLTDVSARWIRR